MEEVLFSQTEMVSVSTLKPYGKNPRKGNVRAIAESLATNKQYRPIVVQKSTKQILAGNHTWQAAKSLGWKQIAVVFVDVNDDEAKKIVLADNRTNDLAEYDDKVLGELLSSLGTITGTGYNESDMEALLNSMTQSIDDIDDASAEVENRALLSADPLADDVSGYGDDEDDDYGKVTAEDDDDDTLEAQTSELGGVVELSDYKEFPGCGLWDFPKLREDMLITELPPDLKTWAGSATRDDDHDGYWLYNWGVDSTSGMKDLSKIMLAFYTHDDYFESWWDNTAKMVGKLINAKIKYAIMPNYSSGDMPKAVSVYNNFKSWWVARYLQEVGIKVMPDMECRTEPEFIQQWRKCMPKRIPWLATQMQNAFTQTRSGKKATEQDWIDLVRFASGEQIAGMEIENILVYAPTNKWDLIKSNWQNDSNLHFFPTRVELLAERAKNRAKSGL